jgi:hypothetical protein
MLPFQTEITRTDGGTPITDREVAEMALVAMIPGASLVSSEDAEMGLWLVSFPIDVHADAHADLIVEGPVFTIIVPAI